MTIRRYAKAESAMAVYTTDAMRWKTVITLNHEQAKDAGAVRMYQMHRAWARGER